jgi:hypothetical protein
MKIKLKFLPLLLLSLFCFGCGSNEDPIQDQNEGYTSLYNGKDLNNWNLMCRDDDPDLPGKVFTPGANGELHVFKDYPDEYGFKENRNDTHGMMFTKKSYSRYSFKFEYKWGTKRFNNFDQFQYDAGAYYHTFKEAVWPNGIEYQIRYNHLKDRNHTGDIWNSGSSFDWIAGPDTTYLPKSEGGTVQERRQGEHRARNDAKFNALNGEWNECEFIVMGDEYSIHKLNGEVVNVLTNLGHKEGTIGLQSETAEIFYRNIMVKEFDRSIPIDEFIRSQESD